MSKLIYNLNILEFFLSFILILTRFLIFLWVISSRPLLSFKAFIALNPSYSGKVFFGVLFHILFFVCMVFIYLIHQITCSNFVSETFVCSGSSLDMYICIHVRDKGIYSRGI